MCILWPCCRTRHIGSVRKPGHLGPIFSTKSGLGEKTNKPVLHLSTPVVLFFIIMLPKKDGLCFACLSGWSVEALFLFYSFLFLFFFFFFKRNRPEFDSNCDFVRPTTCHERQVTQAMFLAVVAIDQFSVLLKSQFCSRLWHEEVIYR